MNKQKILSNLHKLSVEVLLLLTALEDKSQGKLDEMEYNEAIIALKSQISNIIESLEENKE